MIKCLDLPLPGAVCCEVRKMKSGMCWLPGWCEKRIAIRMLLPPPVRHFSRVAAKWRVTLESSLFKNPKPNPPPSASQRNVDVENPAEFFFWPPSWQGAWLIRIIHHHHHRFMLESPLPVLDIVAVPTCCYCWCCCCVYAVAVTSVVISPVVNCPNRNRYRVNQSVRPQLFIK